MFHVSNILIYFDYQGRMPYSLGANGTVNMCYSNHIILYHHTSAAISIRGLP